jgi:hypothetical protein
MTDARPSSAGGAGAAGLGPETPEGASSGGRHHPHACVPVGASEIGRMLGRPHTTVQTWWARTRRGELPVPMPDPIGTVSGRPAWCRAMVQAWARQTGRVADGIPQAKPQ